MQAVRHGGWNGKLSNKKHTHTHTTRTQPSCYVTKRVRSFPCPRQVLAEMKLLRDGMCKRTPGEKGAAVPGLVLRNRDDSKTQASASSGKISANVLRTKASAPANQSGMNYDIQQTACPGRWSVRRGTGRSKEGGVKHQHHTPITGRVLFATHS